MARRRNDDKLARTKIDGCRSLGPFRESEALAHSLGIWLDERHAELTPKLRIPCRVIAVAMGMSDEQPQALCARTRLSLGNEILDDVVQGKLRSVGGGAGILHKHRVFPEQDIDERRFEMHALVLPQDIRGRVELESLDCRVLVAAAVLGAVNPDLVTQIGGKARIHG